MARLIIQHDDRQTEYELTDAAVLIGRDPECELFFADRKLSRRHARFERDGSGFSLVDLDSRNGSWVNEERVKKRRLGHDDVVRLGSLSIRFQQEEPAHHAEEEATVYLAGTGPAQDEEGRANSTVVLGSGSLPDARAPEPLEPPPPTPEGPVDNATRALEISELDEPESDGAAPDEAAKDDPATRMVPAVAPEASDDTATKMLDSPASVSPPASDAASGSTDDSATRMVPSPGHESSEDSVTRVAPSPDSESRPRPPAGTDDSATRMIGGAGEDSATKLAPSAADDSATRLGPGPPDSDTMGRPAGDTGARTVLVPDDTGERKAGTVVYRGGDEPEGPSELGAPAEAGLGRARPATDAAAARASWDEPPEPVTSRSWTTSFAVLSVTLALFALAVLVLPLTSTSTRVLDEETSTKGRLMMELLAAVNASALGEGRRDSASVVVVENTPGVTGAYVLDTASRIVAPAARAGEDFSIEGLDVPAGSVRSIRSGRTPDGDLVVAGPVTYRGRRVGVALVTFRAPTSNAFVVLAIGCLLLLMGLVAAILYGRRMTLVPLQELRSDIEALARYEGDSLVEERAYREVAELARAVNRLVSRPRE